MIILIPPWLVYAGSIIGFLWLAGTALLAWKFIQYLSDCLAEIIEELKNKPEG